MGVQEIRSHRQYSKPFFNDTRTQKPKIERISGGIFQAKRYGYLVFDNAKWGFKKFQAKSRDRDAGIKVRCLNIIRFWNRVFHLT